MKTSTFISKIKRNPNITLGGGAVIVNTKTDEILDVFHSGVSASKFWVKTYRRNPDIVVRVKASLFDCLAEKKVLRDVWCA